MTTNRRDFLQHSALAGASFALAGGLTTLATDAALYSRPTRGGAPDFPPPSTRWDDFQTPIRLPQRSEFASPHFLSCGKAPFRAF